MSSEPPKPPEEIKEAMAKRRQAIADEDDDAEDSNTTSPLDTTTETSAAETPAAETPAAETPAAETPAAETPAAETPAAETPAASSAIAEESTPRTIPPLTNEEIRSLLEEIFGIKNWRILLAEARKNKTSPDYPGEEELNKYEKDTNDTLEQFQKDINDAGYSKEEVVDYFKKDFYKSFIKGMHDYMARLEVLAKPVSVTPPSGTPAPDTTPPETKVEHKADSTPPSETFQQWRDHYINITEMRKRYNEIPLEKLNTTTRKEFIFYANKVNALEDKLKKHFDTNKNEALPDALRREVVSMMKDFRDMEVKAAKDIKEFNSKAVIVPTPPPITHQRDRASSTPSAATSQTMENLLKKSYEEITKGIQEKSGVYSKARFDGSHQYNNMIIKNGEDVIKRSVVPGTTPENPLIKTSINRNAAPDSLDLFCQMNRHFPLKMKPCGNPEKAVEVLEAAQRQGAKIILDQADITAIQESGNEVLKERLEAVSVKAPSASAASSLAR